MDVQIEEGWKQALKDEFRQDYFRDIVQFLEEIAHGYLLVQPVKNNFSEVFFNIFPDDEHDFFKSGPERIKNGIIKDRLPGRSNPVDLFQGSVAAADPGSHDKKGWFHILVYVEVKLINSWYGGYDI